MKYAEAGLALLVILAPCAVSAQAAEQQPPTIDAADRLFQNGAFVQAGEQYAQIAADHPDDYRAALQLGRIALLSNRLDDAENWLETAITLRPSATDPRIMLAEVYYRGDDFQKAATSLNGIDVSANPLVISQYPTLNVAKLQSFEGQTPYELHGTGQSTCLKFIMNCTAPGKARV